MDIGSLSVLAVDDNEYNRDLLSRYLKRQGHVVTLAEDGAEALELARRQQFDLILLDLMMPQMDGFQVLAAMQADPRLRDVPVIVISAMTDTDKLLQCLRLGAQDYLFKPLHSEYLKARIKACIEKRLLAA
jgi:adenylate cyclase